MSPNFEHTHGGTAILSRFGFSDIRQATGLLAGRGQYVEAEIGGLHVASVYVSLNNSEGERNAFQEEFDRLSATDLALVAGDFNIIATPSDAAVKYGATAIGCKPWEREWMARLKTQWIDILPQINTERPLFTWWSSDARFQQNLGTRLDYQFATPNLASKVLSARIFRQQFRGQRISDHGPVVSEYAIEPVAPKLSVNSVGPESQERPAGALEGLSGRKASRASVAGGHQTPLARRAAAADRPGHSRVALERLEEAELEAGVTFEGLFLQDDDDFGSARFLAIKGLMKPANGAPPLKNIDVTAVLYDEHRRVLDVATDYISVSELRRFRPFNLTLQVPKGERPAALCIYPAVR